MATLKSNLLTFVRVFTQHPMCIANGILLAAITGIEQAFEAAVFKCPEKQTSSDRELYAIVSVVCPAVALWILGILGSNLAWRLCQGLSSRKDKQECGCCCYPCWCNFLIVLIRTLVIPLVWILIVLMDGDMYACYYWKPNDDEWSEANKSFSQLIGWMFFGVCLLLGLIVVFCHRYYSKRTYFPHIYSNKLKRAERLQLEKLLKAKAEEDAKRNAGALMMGYSEFSAEDWESICREKTKAEMVTVEATPTPATGEAPVIKEVIQFHSPAQEFLDQRKDLYDKYDNSASATEQGANAQQGNTQVNAENLVDTGSPPA